MTACRNPNCGSSTGIHEGLTFGSGRLDELGYWEFPCAICARASDARMPEIIREIHWEYVREGYDWDMAHLHMLRQHDWLFIESWPMKGHDIHQMEIDWQKDNAERFAEDEKFDRELEEMLGPTDPPE